MCSPIVFSAKLLRFGDGRVSRTRNFFLVAAFLLTIPPSLCRAQALPLFRIAYGVTGENPAALWGWGRAGVLPQAWPERGGHLHAQRAFVDGGNGLGRCADELY